MIDSITANEIAKDINFIHSKINTTIAADDVQAMIKSCRNIKELIDNKEVYLLVNDSGQVRIVDFTEEIKRQVVIEFKYDLIRMSDQRFLHSDGSWQPIQYLNNKPF